MLSATGSPVVADNAIASSSKSPQTSRVSQLQPAAVVSQARVGILAGVIAVLHLAAAAVTARMAQTAHAATG